MSIAQRLHFVNALAPVADAFAGATAASDIVNCEGHHSMMFLLIRGAAAGAGTTVPTIIPCSDAAATATGTAVPFHYRTITMASGTTGDVEGAWTLAANTGFTWGAGASQMCVIEVNCDELAASGYSWVKCNCAEGTDAAYVGAMVAIMGEPRITGATQATVVS